MDYSVALTLLLIPSCLFSRLLAISSSPPFLLLFSPSPLRPILPPCFPFSALPLFLRDRAQEMTHVPALELQVPRRMPPLKRNATKDGGFKKVSYLQQKVVLPADAFGDNSPTCWGMLKKPNKWSLCDAGADVRICSVAYSRLDAFLSRPSFMGCRLFRSSYVNLLSGEKENDHLTD